MDLFMSLHFPIADTRYILGRPETGMLSHPTWPIPAVGTDFIRFFGDVRNRRGGYTEGVWTGVDTFCSGDRGMRFVENHNLGKDIGRTRVFRRFYSSGGVACWYEILFVFEVGIRSRFAQGGNVMELLFDRLQQLSVHIDHTREDKKQISLFGIGPCLSERYLLASTKTGFSGVQKWWVSGGEPALFTVTALGQYPRPIPANAARSENFAALGIDLFYFPFFRDKQRIIHWIAGLAPAAASVREDVILRSIRINLLRLHVEKECLKTVLRHVIAGHFELVRGTPVSENLQAYLRDALKQIYARQKALTNNAVVDTVFRTHALFTRQEKENLRASLDFIRRNLFRQLDVFLEE